MLCKLVKKQSAPQVDLELFDGNPFEYIYFMQMFRESTIKKIEDPDTINSVYQRRGQRPDQEFHK